MKKMKKTGRGIDLKMPQPKYLTPVPTLSHCGHCTPRNWSISWNFIKNIGFSSILALQSWKWEQNQVSTGQVFDFKLSQKIF